MCLRVISRPLASVHSVKKKNNLKIFIKEKPDIQDLLKYCHSLQNVKGSCSDRSALHTTGFSVVILPTDKP